MGGWPPVVPRSKATEMRHGEVGEVNDHCSIYLQHRHYSRH